jgi:hypothetical protein
MKFFGVRYRYAAYDEAEHVETPVGARCAHCEEPIHTGDDGWVLPLLDRPGHPTEAPFHRACFMRNTIGSVAHQQRLCCCFLRGSTKEDDPALTRRQAAEAAMAYFYWSRN